MRLRKAARLAVAHPMTTVDPVLQSVCVAYPADAHLIIRAYECADQLHQGQRRYSGDPYITHTVAVAAIIAELGLTAAVVCAALLHDVLSDTPYTIAELRTQFGNEIADLVADLTRLEGEGYADPAARGCDTMTHASAEVLALKVADRLHNMRTIRYLSPHKQQTKSRQTLRVIAPLARSLGMDAIGGELEHLATAVLHPTWDKAPALSGRILGAAVLVLPPGARRRWREEWTAELAVLSTRRARASFVLQLLRGSPRLAMTLHRPARRHDPR
ncbi:MAG TPA: HD domain-containing protein [Mycobacteriales bacterium]|nr:HD domain-containing protein [Mycobacteriales bacterium]